MKWNAVCPHIVTEQEMNIYEFDSKRLDQTYKQTEIEGDHFIQNHFFNGNVLSRSATASSRVVSCKSCNSMV